MADRLGEFDIGLLTAFEAMARERNVSRAATSLGITQSALSSRLGRLRALFDDQLFVPVAGRGVAPTPRAETLAGEVGQLLARLRSFIGPATTFDPISSDRTFVIATYDNPAAMLGPDLIPALKRRAPHVRLAFVLPETEDVAATLERGDVDLFVGLLKTRQPDLISRGLFNEAFMTAQRRGHPRGTEPLTLDAFCAADHLLISAEGGEFSGIVDNALAKLGRARRVSVSIQSYGLAPLILASGDCLCTLPQRFLMRFREWLDIFQPPIELDQFHLRAVWHARMRDDVAHRWLREQLFLIADAIGAAD